jgi:peroxiredoxin Q/BCP
MLKTGMPAPDFTAKLDDGSDFRLSDHRGKPVVLYFYPADETPGCTTQACSFRDGYGQVRQHGASIYGISTDSTESHQAFREHHSLPFQLIADTTKQIRKLYDAETLFGFLTARVTYVIDAEGIIRQAFRSDLRPKTHIDAIVSALQQLPAAPARI